jgi:hypothetical protein
MTEARLETEGECTLRLQTLSRDSVIQLLISGLVKTDAVSDWDPFRIQRIIRKKQKQLPDGRPGVVVITTDWTLLFHANGVGAVISELEAVLRDLPRLSCAVACCTYGGGEKEGYVASYGQHTAVKRVTEAGLTEEAVISFNPSCTVPLPDGSFDKVRDAFIRG